ncbi:MAG: HDIG domain-containing protein [Ignavibacteria bacterium]|nr:HDIG domain-containing protein [Ignavibacteria bacterium]
MSEKSFIKDIFRSKESYNLKSGKLIKLLIGIITVFILSLLLPSYQSMDVEFELGSVWNKEDLIAPFSFPVYKDDKEYEMEKKQVILNINPIFLEVDNLQNIMSQFDSLKSYIEKIISESSVLEKRQQQIDFNPVEKYITDKFQFDINVNQLLTLLEIYNKSNEQISLINFNELLNTIRKNLVEVNQLKIINISKNEITSDKISIKRESEKIQILENTDKILDKTEAVNYFSSLIFQSLNDTNLKLMITGIGYRYIAENLIYDKSLTELEIQSRIEQIPKTIGIVQENERIVSKHDPINRVTKLKLESYKKIRLERFGVQDFVKQYIGRILTAFILLTILAIFLYYMRIRIFNDNYKLILISSLIIIESVFAYLSMQLKIEYPLELLIFVSVSSIMLTILFDSRLAFFTVVIIVFITASIRGGDFAVAFIGFCGSVLAIFSVRDIKNRSQIFRSAYFIFAGYTIAIFAIGFDKIDYTKNIVSNLIFGGLNAIMSPIVAYGLLIFYEKTFRITTDLTLLELADFNHPLLKKLSALSPGTFHHSVVMGNMAEAAAESIGANRILARVGCYYHDIGKTLKPEYFVENQLDRKSKHENLNPNISAKVIISHVKEGIELAKEHKLPKEVIDFIPMHHGTTLVSYFYHKAKSLMDEEKENISDYIYRYPGPKPQTKETGIAMLADTIEASTRIIEDPTLNKLEEKIDEVIKRRFAEGELDECDLTLKDLTKIKIAFLKILVGIHHQRIKYPEDEMKEKPKSLFDNE